jgi:ribose 5-phosphate isomerase A
MVAQASERVVIIADEAKAVKRLGSTFPLPIEVVRWGWRAHVRFLEGWGAEVTPRTAADGTLVESDNGQLLLDCRFRGGIEDPESLEAALKRRAGIVETGLFLGLADEALIASEDGVSVLERGR